MGKQKLKKRTIAKVRGRKVPTNVKAVLKKGHLVKVKEPRKIIAEIYHGKKLPLYLKGRTKDNVLIYGKYVVRLSRDTVDLEKLTVNLPKKYFDILDLQKDLREELNGKLRSELLKYTWRELQTQEARYTLQALIQKELAGSFNYWGICDPNAYIIFYKATPSDKNSKILRCEQKVFKKVKNAVRRDPGNLEDVIEERAREIALFRVANEPKYFVERHYYTPYYTELYKIALRRKARDPTRYKDLESYVSETEKRTISHRVFNQLLLRGW